MKTKPFGYWNVKKEKLRQRYPYLTDSDLRFNMGKEKEMIEMLGYKMGISKQALLEIIVTI
ncbi:MAG: general stress protein CsbD [Bacteroidales bacterium]|nr:general stress protein CsbD [Bacteroidales bacterium]MBK8882311.1 general stress protein CsbD [Bacteroidales bacterium]